MDENTKLRRALTLASKAISSYKEAIHTYKHFNFTVQTEAEIDEIIDNILTRTFNRNN